MKVMKMGLLSEAQNFLGVLEGSSDHHRIIDKYNTLYPLPRGYKVTYMDSWCAVFVSVCAMLAEITDFPFECGCQEMFDHFSETKDRGWTPSPESIIFYDWNGDGHCEHVGIVESCDGQLITVIEGNHNDSVAYRRIKVGNTSIYGYGVIKMNVKETIWNHLMSWILNPFGVAGMMGNIRAESALKPTNLQDKFNTTLKMTDDEYTKAVDNGSYSSTQFINDKAGYGLCQWTFWSRKKALLEHSKATGKSIGDLWMQLEFLKIEMTLNYPDLLETLKHADSVRDASNAVLFGFEKPADTGVKVQDLRCSYSEEYFNEFFLAPTKTTINPEDFLNAVGRFVKKCKAEGWEYDDSHSWDDKKTSCDRMVSKVLYYDFGITDQPEGGWDSKALEKHLPEIGFRKITDPADLQGGDIVFMGKIVDGQWDDINHTMVIVDYDPNTQMCHKYDQGEQWRIDSDQPFYTKLNEWGSKRRFTCAYRAEGSGKSKIDIIRQGQIHSIEFTGHNIKVDGDIGDESTGQKWRVLRHGLNLDYLDPSDYLDENKRDSKLLRKVLENHYVELGEKQHMVCVLEILLELNGIDPKGVEIPEGEFGTGLQGAIGKNRAEAQDFIDLCE